MFSALLFLIVLCVLVVAHEAGHFLVARFFKVRVDEFGIGYPPKALSFGTWNGTEYTLNWLPFGGFVTIYGENGEALSHKDQGDSLASKSWVQQLCILGAGVFANIVLACMLFTFAAWYGAPITVPEDSSLAKSAAVVITSVLPGSPADIAGLKAGDVVRDVVAKNDTLSTIVPSHVTAFVQKHPGKEVTVVVERRVRKEVETLDVIVVPVQGLSQDSVRPAIGISMGYLLREDAPLLHALYLGCVETWRWTVTTVLGVGSLLQDTFSGSFTLESVAGPVGIAGEVGSWYSLGWSYLAYFAGIISVNLAIINLLPFPALDGGRMCVVLCERTLRKKLPQPVIYTMNSIGFLLLVSLMLVVTYNDVLRILNF